MVQLAAEAGKSFNAYLAVPSAPSGQAVVLLQEIFGINANIRGIADEYAAEGCRILLHIAVKDQLCPPEAQAAIKQALTPLGNRVSIMVYPDSGHAFARRGGAGYDETAARRADEATRQFLALSERSWESHP
jgi:carboxymethylenebutenolidase